MNLVDLHVYVDGSEALRGGSLYDFTYSEVTPDFPLPFTYPPFAALVFFPLHFLPFPPGRGRLATAHHPRPVRAGANEPRARAR